MSEYPKSCNLGEIYIVRDFINEDLSKYVSEETSTDVIVRRKNIDTGNMIRININKSTIGVKYIHAGLKMQYENTPYLTTLNGKGLGWNSPHYHLPREFIKSTGDRIIDTRKLTTTQLKYVITALASEDRAATYNTHGFTHAGNIRNKALSAEWYAQNAVHFFLENVTTPGLVKTMNRALSSNKNMMVCPNCSKLTHINDIADQMEDQGPPRYECPRCKKLLDLVLHDSLRMYPKIHIQER